MITKDNLELYLIRNCKSWKSLDGIRDFHRLSFSLGNAELDTKYSRDHYHSSDKTKCYYWHSGGADIGNSFNYIVKKILNDFKKGIIKLKEIQ